MNANKKLTAQAKACIKGEAFFESLISDYALPHHIVGPKDLGIDYICEWVHQDEPTGILFGVQIKTYSAENVRPQNLNELDERNKLQRFKISHNLLNIKKPTLAYWKGLGFPVYLFVMIYSADRKMVFNCYYKRFTYRLTKPNITAKQKKLKTSTTKLTKATVGPLQRRRLCPATGMCSLRPAKQRRIALSV